MDITTMFVIVKNVKMRPATTLAGVTVYGCEWFSIHPFHPFIDTP